MNITNFALFLSLLVLCGCASGPSQSLSQYAETRVQQVMSFSGCPHGVEEEDKRTSAEVEITGNSDPGYDWYGRRAPAVVERQRYTGTAQLKCKASPQVEKARAERAAAEERRANAARAREAREKK